MKGRSPAIKERSDAIAPKGAVGEAHKAGGHTTTEGRSPVTRKPEMNRPKSGPSI